MFKRKNLPASPSASIRSKLLFPKLNGLTNDKKPLLLILSSPHDSASDSATKYQPAVDLASERGYAVINKKKIIYDLNVDAFRISDTQLIKANGQIEKSKGVTIWLETHGLPGYLFGDQPNLQEEKKATLKFSEYLKEIEEKTGLTIKNIILNACYSAVEFVNTSNNQFLYSPARLLSAMMPGVVVVGFQGKNSSVKISDVWECSEAYENQNAFVLENAENLNARIVPLVDASIAFKDGQAIEFSERVLFSKMAHLSKFILECMGVEAGSEQCLRLCLAKEAGIKLGIGREELNLALNVEEAAPSSESSTSRKTRTLR